MSFSALLSYVRSIIATVPLEHWAMVVVSSLVLTVSLLIRKKSSVYGAICLGISVFIGLFFLDVAVFYRYFGTLPKVTGFKFTFSRLLQSNEHGQVELFANLVAFGPLGFFLSEFLASAKRFSIGRRLGLVTLAAFGLSFCIECLQLVLRVGFFEVTDLVMNTAGSFLGASLARLVRSLIGYALNDK